MKTRPNYKKLMTLLSCVLAVGLLISSAVFPVSAKSQDNHDERQFSLGYTPYKPMDLGKIHLKPGAVVDDNTHLNHSLYIPDNTLTDNSPLPAAYDLRTQNRVPPIKEQSWGTCWSFAATTAAESNIISDGYATTNNINLSEKALVYFTYNETNDKLGNLAGDRTYAVSSPDNVYDEGGNDFLATATFAAWKGLTPESAYSGLAFNGEAESQITQRFNSDVSYRYDQYHLKNALYVDITDKAAIKKMIRTYGAGVMSFNWNYDALSDDEKSYYSDEEAYYGGHAVTLIGWDDNYAVENFRAECRPSAPGAWLLQNSWGSDWGDNGYFWVSYEDWSLIDGHYDWLVAFYDAEPVGNDYNIYQHDGNGLVSSLEIDNGGKVANVFKCAEDGEYLSKVGFYTWYENAQYTIQVYTGVTGGPESGTKAFSTNVSGSFRQPGYHVVTLPSTVALTKNQKFSIVLGLTESYGYATYLADATSYTYVYNEDIEDFERVQRTNSATEAGESYAYDGGWIDLYTNEGTESCVVCLKGITQKSSAITPDPDPDPGPDPSCVELEVYPEVACLYLDDDESSSIQLDVEAYNIYEVELTNITFESSDESVAVVFDDGTITAVAPGRCEITVTCEPIIKTIPVFVSEEYKFWLDPSFLKLVPGDTAAVAGYYWDYDTDSEKSVPLSAMTFESTDTSVATVNSQGVITGVDLGSAGIVASYDGSYNYAEVYVDMAVVDPHDVVIAPNETFQLNIKTADGVSYTCDTDDEDIATITASGLITGVSAGNTYYNFYWDYDGDGQNDRYTWGSITVTDISITDPADGFIFLYEPGQTYQIQAESEQELTYEAYYENVLVTSTGKVIGITPDSNDFIIVSDGESFITIDVYVGGDENEKYVVEFAKKLYTVVLGRDPEAEGLIYWTETLMAGYANGADVAYGFFFSDEYKARNRSDEEYVRDLYETFMGRVPGQDELNYWVGELAAGATREDIFRGFTYSEEWKYNCYDYVITPNGDAPPATNRVENVYAFASRLYTCCLGRDADEDGIDYWASLLLSRQATGTNAAYGFFFCDEFVNANHSDREFIIRLYNTLMNRTPSEEDISYWCGELSAGAARTDIFTGFASSQEFKNICDSYCIRV